MPAKNPDRKDLNSYKVHFINKEILNVHSPNKLIAELGKPDKGGFHPVFTVDDEVFLNINNVNFIENVTPAPKEE